MKVNCWGVLAGAFILAHAGAALGGTNVWTDTGPQASDVQVQFSSADVAYARGGGAFDYASALALFALLAWSRTRRRFISQS